VDDNALWAVAHKRLSGRCFWDPTHSRTVQALVASLGTVIGE
jgi:hypothetical protein